MLVYRLSFNLLVCGHDETFSLVFPALVPCNSEKLLLCGNKCRPYQYLSVYLLR